MATLAFGIWAGTSAGPVSASTTLPMSGLAAGAMVLTLTGAKPVETLAPGDRVIAQSGIHVVTAVNLAIVRAARMVRIRAGAFGKNRPVADVLVTPQQHLLVRNGRAKAITGADPVVLTADRLVDGTDITRETVAEARIMTLSFAQPQVIYAAGLELCCTVG